MRVLVTGATGFTGRVLVRYLADLGEQALFGMARSRQPDPSRQLGVQYVQCDLLDAARVHEVILRIRPDRIIHLAGLNRGTHAELFRANGTGTRNLLDAVHAANPLCRTLVVSSSAVYGYTGKKPIDENTPIKPLGNYGTSKAAQEQVALEGHANGGAQVSTARPFNLVGPGQPDSFVCGRIVKQAMEIERGQRRNIELLETQSYRDFIDVRDAVRAYWALVSHPDFERVCSGNVFNIGSGTAHSVSDVIALIEKITGRTFIVEMPEDPPVVPIPFQQADISRIQHVTGWRPEIPLKESLADMIEAVRKVGI